MNKIPKVNSWSSINLYTIKDKKLFPNENFDVVYSLERDGSVEDFTNARNTFIVFNRTHKTIQLWCRSGGIDWSSYGNGHTYWSCGSYLSSLLLV